VYFVWGEGAALRKDAGGTPVPPIAVRLVPLNAAFKERVVGLEHVTGMYPVMWKVTRMARGGGKMPSGAGVPPGISAEAEPARAFDAELGGAISG